MSIAAHLHFDLDDEIVGALYLKLLRKVLEANNVAFDERVFSSSELVSPRGRVSLRQLITTFSSTLDKAPPGLGFRYGESLNLVAADTLGLLVMSCDTLGEAAEHLRTYKLLLGLPIDFELSSNIGNANEHGQLELKGLCIDQLDHHFNFFAGEALTLAIIRQASWLCGEQLEYKELHFPYPAPKHAHLYETHFKCPCFFNCDKHVLVFDKDYFQRKVITSNSEIKAEKLLLCHETLQRWEKSFSLSQRLRALFKQTFPELPSNEDAAELLKLSKSALHRKLAEEGTSYQSLLNDFKRERSEYYLKHTDLTINEIAERVGFSDGSTFRRAFKTWTGQQPSQLRSK